MRGHGSLEGNSSVRGHRARVTGLQQDRRSGATGELRFTFGDFDANGRIRIRRNDEDSPDILNDGVTRVHAQRAGRIMMNIEARLPDERQLSAAMREVARYGKPGLRCERDGAP